MSLQPMGNALCAFIRMECTRACVGRMEINKVRIKDAYSLKVLKSRHFQNLLKHPPISRYSYLLEGVPNRNE